MQVVGKRHYGRKAREAGGGGGRKTSRELFDTLLFWKARVKLDADGRASVEVPLNDSLTSFRIVAVADAGADLFGTGQTSIRSTQELMLFSGLPPLVREQDSYRATFTVRNASDGPLEVQARASMTRARPVACARPRRTRSRSRSASRGRVEGSRLGRQGAGGCGHVALDARLRARRPPRAWRSRTA